MNLHIRPETPGDYFQVENVIRQAFWNLYCPGCNEHWIVHNLRDHPDFFPELSFLLQREGEIVGSIFYSKSKVLSPDGRVHDTLTFGPVCILPRFHRQGLGRALISHSIAKAKELGFRALLIGGYAYHYRPYGFVPAKQYGICLPDGNYYTGILALPLEDGGLDGISGQLHFSPALEPSEEGFAAFDRLFPFQPKLVLPSQAEFAAAVSEIDVDEYPR